MPNKNPPIARTLVALVLAFIAAPAAAVAPSPAERVEVAASPAVVQIYCGWVARWSWSGKTLQIASIRGGTGFFIHPDGYILTSAHVVVSMMESPQRLKTLAGTGLLQAFLKANGYGQDEDSQRLLLDRIRQGQLAEPQLVELRRINVVVLPGGGRFPFQIRSFGVPLGQEGPEVLTGRDVAVLKVDVHDAPTLRLGSSAAVPSGTAVWSLAYPPATDSDALDESSRPEAAASAGTVAARQTARDGTPFLQADVAPKPGSSGGPVLDAQGEVIGLLTFPGDTVDGRTVAGPGFILPIDTAVELVRQAGAQYEGRSAAGADRTNPGTSAGSVPTPGTSGPAPDQEASSTSGRIAGLPIWAVVAMAAGGGLLLILLVVVVVLAVRRKADAAAGTPPTAAQPYPTPSSARLTCVVGPLQGRDFPVGAGVVIGRDPSQAQLVVPDSQVSGRHLWVGPAGAHVVARDLGSSNGTFLNGQRLTEAPLHEGDVLVLGQRGSVQLVFHA